MPSCRQGRESLNEHVEKWAAIKNRFGYELQHKGKFEGEDPLSVLRPESVPERYHYIYDIPKVLEAAGCKHGIDGAAFPNSREQYGVAIILGTNVSDANPAPAFDIPVGALAKCGILAVNPVVFLGHKKYLRYKSGMGPYNEWRSNSNAFMDGELDFRKKTMIEAYGKYQEAIVATSDAAYELSQTLRNVRKERGLGTDEEFRSTTHSDKITFLFQHGIWKPTYAEDAAMNRADTACRMYFDALERSLNDNTIPALKDSLKGANGKAVIQILPPEVVLYRHVQNRLVREGLPYISIVSPEGDIEK